MIGNDIICLASSDVSTTFLNPRYMDKIYSPAEQEMIFSSPNPGLCHWRYWALKESAYKVWVKHSQQRLFAPKRLIVNALPSQKIMEVETPDGVVYARADIRNAYVSAVASSEVSLLENLYWGIKKKPKTQNASIAVRQNLWIHLQKLFPFVELKNFIVEKSPLGVPSLYIDGVNKKFDLSLSHHGNFVSYAFTIQSYD